MTDILGALDITTSRALAPLPRLDRLVHERASSPAYRMRADGRPRIQLAVQVTLAGRGLAWSDEGEIELPPGSALVFVVGADLRYGFPPGGGPPWDFLYANLEGEAAIAIGHELVARHGHRVDLGRGHPLLGALLRRLPARGHRHLRWGAAESARVAWDLIQAVVDAAERADDTDADLVDVAMHLLLAGLDAPSDVGALAARLGVSREHLTRRFAAETGSSPAAWQREQRLRHATLLLRGGCGVSETAARCGFATTSHFIQVFKRAYARTPAAYARGESGS